MKKIAKDALFLFLMCLQQLLGQKGRETHDDSVDGMLILSPEDSVDV